MIVKKVKYNPDAQPKPVKLQIRDMVDYIRSPRDTNPLEKIEYSGSRGFLAGTHEGQRAEMIALATESAHSRMPVTHWIFSWKENEQPTPDQVDELVDIFLERMELSGHQAIYGLHYNTENYHVHIAVNRMSPDTGKVVQPHKGFDIEAAHRVLAEVEYKQGWSREKNGRYTLDDSGRIIRTPRQEQGPKPKAPALDFEARTGDKSAQRIAQERGHGVIQNAQSWSELHEGLRKVGLRFEKKGSGAILFVGDIAVKASSVDRAFSMGKLCKRLGEFVPGDYEDDTMESDMPKIVPEPVSPAHERDWRAYRGERENTLAQVQQANTRQEATHTELKMRHSQERTQLARRLTGKKLPALNHARHDLAVKQREERRELLLPRQRSGKRRQSFKSWLKAQGRNRQTERWRYRNRSIPVVLSASVAEKPGNALVAYAAHWQESQEKNARRATLAAAMALYSKIPSTPPESSSRQDAQIAVLMRAEGYDKETVIEAIWRSAPELWKDEKRDWQRYATRIANYAFGLAGDMELVKLPAQMPRPEEKQEQKVVETTPPLKSLEPSEPSEEPVEEVRYEAPRLRMR